MSDTTTTPDEYRKAAAKAMPERELQENVRQLCKSLGWYCYHTFDSRRSEPGFPDLVLVRMGRLIFAELKTETGRESLAQERWADRLGNVQRHNKTVQYQLWRPTQWLDGTIERILRGETT